MTLSVNVVVKDGWILGRCARELAKRLPGVVVNETPWPPSKPSTTAATYFMPEKDLRHMAGDVIVPGRGAVPKREIPGLIVGLFTHDFERMRFYVDRFDACVAMNAKAGEYLRRLGGRNVRVIRPGTAKPDRPIRFGVCGRVYGKGRKGAHLVEAAVREGFSFQACSELLPARRGRPPCRITHSIEERSRFYREIDYLVVTSTEEGGPMPVIEAIAHGCPVIAPEVGWAWEFPVIRYQCGDWRSLRSVLLGLTEPPLWSEWAEQHAELFATLEAQRDA